MTTIKELNYDRGFSVPDGLYPFQAIFQDPDLEDAKLVGINDELQIITVPTAVVIGANTSVTLGQFDSNGTPTGTFSLVLTNVPDGGAVTHEIIADATIGRTANHDMARVGERAADDLVGIGLILTGTFRWEIQLRLTAALATVTTTGRKVFVSVEFLNGTGL